MAAATFWIQFLGERWLVMSTQRTCQSAPTAFGRANCYSYDVIASPSTYPCQWVGEWVIWSFRFGDSYRISELCKLVCFYKEAVLRRQEVAKPIITLLCSFWQEIHPSLKEIHFSFQETHSPLQEIHLIFQEIHSSLQEIHPFLQEIHTSYWEILSSLFSLKKVWFCICICIWWEHGVWIPFEVEAWWYLKGSSIRMYAQPQHR